MSGRRLKSLISCARQQPETPKYQGNNMDRGPVLAESLDLSRLRDWSPKQVRVYIESTLNLPGKYGAAIEEQAIGGEDILEIVAENNHEQLKEIGIMAVGHRNKIIRAFRSSASMELGGEKLPGNSERKTQEKTSHDVVLDRHAYGPMWDNTFPGIPQTGSVPDTRFFEFFARTTTSRSNQKQIWVMCVGEKHSCTFDEFVLMMKMTCYVQLGVPPNVLSVKSLQTDHPIQQLDLSPPTGKLDNGTSSGGRGGRGGGLTTIPTSAAAFAGLPSVTHLSQQQPQTVALRTQPSPNPSPLPTQDPEFETIVAQASHNVMFRNLPQEVLDSDDHLYSLESLALHVFNPIHFEIDGSTLIATFDNDITQAILSQIRDKTVQALISMGIETHKVQRCQLEIPPVPQSREQIRIRGENYETPMGPDPTSSAYPTNNQVPYQNGYPDVPPPPPPGPGDRGMMMQQPPRSGSSYGQQHDPSNFYDFFMSKVNLDGEFATIRDGRLRTMNVMNIIAKLRGVGSSKDVTFHDGAIKELVNLNRDRLDMYLRNINPRQIDILMGKKGTQSSMGYAPTAQQMVGASQSSERLGGDRDRDRERRNRQTGSERVIKSKEEKKFVGVVISGLPETITENDDSLLQLDAIVLQDVTVEHIEVVGTTLRITFGGPISKAALTAMRKSLRDFLFENGLQKREVKNVTIAPHTSSTWKNNQEETPAPAYSSHIPSAMGRNGQDPQTYPYR